MNCRNVPSFVPWHFVPFFAWLTKLDRSLCHCRGGLCDDSQSSFLQFLTGKMMKDTAGHTPLPLPTHLALHAHPPPADRSDFPSLEHSIRSLHLGFQAPLTNDSFVSTQLGMEGGRGHPSPWSWGFTASVLPAFSLVTSHFCGWGTAHRRHAVLIVNRFVHFCHWLNS